MKGLDYAKKLFICFAVIGFTFAFCGYTSADLNDGLVAYYPFNGNANDESGNGNDGSVNGATLTEDRFDNENSAYSFDGVNDYIVVNDSDDLDNTNKLTISTWIFPLKLAANSYANGILSKRADAIGAVRRQIVVDKFDKKLRNTFYSPRSFL